MSSQSRYLASVMAAIRSERWRWPSSAENLPTDPEIVLNAIRFTLNRRSLFRLPLPSTDRRWIETPLYASETKKAHDKWKPIYNRCTVSMNGLSIPTNHPRTNINIGTEWLAEYFSDGLEGRREHATHPLDFDLLWFISSVERSTFYGRLFWGAQRSEKPARRWKCLAYYRRNRALNQLSTQFLNGNGIFESWINKTNRPARISSRRNCQIEVHWYRS